VFVHVTLAVVMNSSDAGALGVVLSLAGCLGFAGCPLGNWTAFTDCQLEPAPDAQVACSAAGNVVSLHVLK